MPSIPELTKSDIGKIKDHIRKSTSLNSKSSSLGKASTLPRYLSDIHHQKIHNLQKAELIMAKKSRLRVLLTQKMVAKYGARYKELVIVHVQRLLDRNVDQISSKDLIDLENTVISDIRSKMKLLSKSHERILETAAKNPQAPENIQMPQTDLSSGKFVPMLSAVEGHEWELIAAYDKLQLDERLQKEEEERNSKKSLLKKTLERQIEEAKEIKRRERENELREAAEKNRRDKELFEEERALKSLEIAKRHEEERLIREKQILDIKLRREVELRSVKEAEKAEIEKIQTVRKKEIEMAMARKQEEMKHREEVVRANDELRRMKDVQKREEVNEDARMMREYNRKVEMDATAREDVFNRRYRAMDSHAKQLDQHGNIQSKREQQRIMDEQIVRATEKKAMEEHMDEARRQEERRRAQEKVQAENLEITLRREAERKAARHGDDDYVNMIHSESEKYLRSVADKKAAAVEKQRQYREALLAQMQSSRPRSGKARVPLGEPNSFDERERVLNGGIIKKIVSDASLFTRVQEEFHKARPSSAVFSRRNLTASTVTLGMKDVQVENNVREPAVAWM